MKYKIYPIGLGENTVDTSSFLYRTGLGTRQPNHYGCFLLEDETGKHILVDSGIPDQEEIRHLGIHWGVMEDAPSLEEALMEYNVRLQDIDTVILTHLHWDHAWNLTKLCNAKIYVQRREVQHAIAPKPHEYSAYVLRNPAGGPDWLNNIDRLVYLDGDTQLFEGIEVITTPGHTPGSQTVLVDTADGLYAITADLVLINRNYDEMIPISIFYDVKVWYDSIEKLRKRHAKILPTHDPATYIQKVYG